MALSLNHDHFLSQLELRSGRVKPNEEAFDSQDGLGRWECKVNMVLSNAQRCLQYWSMCRRPKCWNDAQEWKAKDTSDNWLCVLGRRCHDSIHVLLRYQRKSFDFWLWMRGVPGYDKPYNRRICASRDVLHGLTLQYLYGLTRFIPGAHIGCRSAKG